MSAERPRQDGQAGGHPAIVVIGDGDLSDETVRALEASKARVTRLRQPDKGDVRSALEGVAIDYVAVVARADAIVLRMALMVRAVSKDVPLLLTIFDPGIAEQVAREVPHTHVTSLADIVAPSLAGPCIEQRYVAVTIEDDQPVGLVEQDGGVSEEPIPRFRPRRVEGIARALFTPYDKSAGLVLFARSGCWRSSRSRP